MQSNSKLSADQKILLKNLRGDLPDVDFAFMGKTTIAFQHVGDNVEFATAICSDNEKRNRPKVGMYYALQRFKTCQTVKMPFPQFDSMLENAEYIAIWN